MNRLHTTLQDQSPRFRELLDQNRDIVLVFLNVQLTELFDHADEAFMDFAEQAQNNTMQGRFFEAMGGVRNSRNNIEHRFRTAILDGFANFGIEAPSPPSETSNSPELTLLEPDEMEEAVVGDSLIASCRSNYFTQLYALRQRLAVLNQGHKIKEEQIPAGPSHLVRAFRAALSTFPIDPKPKIVLYALFDKFVLRQLQGLYEEINGNLKNAGVLPNLKLVALKPGQSDASIAEPNEESLEEISDTTPEDLDAEGERPLGGENDATAGGGPATKSVDRSNVRSNLGEELFSAILGLMAMRYPNGRGGKHAGTAPRGSAAAVGQGHQFGGGLPRQRLVSAIDRVRPQQVGSGPGVLSDLEALPQLAVDPLFLGKVKEALSHEREQVLSQVDQTEVQSIDANTIDLIGMLFEYMLNDPLLPNVAKALLSHLHTSYLKLALVDQQLLVDNEHPARLLLDLLVEAGGRWVHEHDIKRGIFPQMQKVVNRVLQEATDDAELFHELLDYFRTAMDEQRRKSEAIERRSRDVLKGKERLQAAKKQAIQAIKSRLGQVRLPKPVKQFLVQTWTDRLVFLLLRHQEGTNSPEWRQALQATDDLVWLFQRTTAGAPRRMIEEVGLKVLQEISKAVDSLGGYHEQYLEALRHFLENSQSILDWHGHPQLEPYSEPLFRESELLPGDVTTTATQVPTAPKIPAEAPTAVPIEPAVSPHAPSPDQLTIHEQEMLNKLRKLKFGTWFEFKDTSGAHRLKLSWLSPLTLTCMFVDQAGIRAEVKSLLELARMLGSGQARVLPQPRRHFVQRTLIAIKNALQRSMEATG